MNLNIIRTAGLFSLLLPTLSAWAQMPEMKNVATTAQLKLENNDSQITLLIQNPNKVKVADEPISIVLTDNCPYKSATVKVGGKEIPSQMDDLDSDGIKDELAFVLDLKKKGKTTIEVSFSKEEAAADRYTPRVHAQMFFADKKNKQNPHHIPTDTVSELVDNMYSKMHHHGPAFESDMVAYRIYFDKKQTTDLYGKKSKGLELAESLWYPTDPQLERGFGDDILIVKSTVGVGTLRGWNPTEKKPMNMIDPFKWRQAHIVAKGPIRTVVDMNVQSWQYKGRDLNLKSRYILYAGHRDCDIIQQFEGDTKGLEFVTGVQKVGSTPEVSNDQAGLAASYGKYWPVNDTIKYAMQTCGLAVDIPQLYLSGKVYDENDQFLYGLQTDTNNAILYKMSFCAPDKETFGPKTSKDWFELIKKWKKHEPAIVTLKK